MNYAKPAVAVAAFAAKSSKIYRESGIGRKLHRCYFLAHRRPGRSYTAVNNPARPRNGCFVVVTPKLSPRISVNTSNVRFTIVSWSLTGLTHYVHHQFYAIYRPRPPVSRLNTRNIATYAPSLVRNLFLIFDSWIVVYSTGWKEKSRLSQVNSTLSVRWKNLYRNLPQNWPWPYLSFKVRFPFFFFVYIWGSLGIIDNYCSEKINLYCR